MTSQVLDSMDLEREKGITIKARAVRLEYDANDGQRYALNLIDTPGHVDFSYEVSRSLQACEGAILVVDATQGIEAQTLANVHLALAQGLVIIPVINKIDLPSAQPDLVIEEFESVLAIPREEVLLVSAKEGTGVPEVLEAIVQRVPIPKGDGDAPLQGLIFDSHYDPYKGVVAYVRLFAGRLGQHEPVRLMASGAESEILEIGVFRPQLVPVKELGPGEVGYVATGLKSVRDCQVGDTMTGATRPAAGPAARLQAGQAARLRRPISDRRRGLSGPSRGAREAPPERRVDQLRAGELGRPGHGLPSRLPGPAAHGDRPGAPRARVRPGPDRVRAIGRVPGPADQQSGRGDRRQPGAAAADRRHRDDRRAVGQGQRDHAQPVHRHADRARDEPAWHVRARWSTSTRIACC